ncbi:MAG: ATP-binding protein [Candidatus Tectimicrobiota bacterium]
MPDTSRLHDAARTRSRRAVLPATGEGRLVRRTFLLAVLLVSGGLLTSGVIEPIFRYRESVASMEVLQHEMAQSAAFKIQQYISLMTHTLRTVGHLTALVPAGSPVTSRSHLHQLLRLSPAMTTASAVDMTGRAWLTVSRVHLVPPDEVTDQAGDTAYLQARTGTPFFGEVYFVRQSEPYMRLAVPMEPFAGEVRGVLMAEVNLKHIWEVIAAIKAGQTGYAYVVSQAGDLIAHPDLSLVLQKQNLRHLAQVQRALDGVSQTVTVRNLRGEPVFATAAVIPELGWAVLVERATAEAYAPVAASVRRMALLLLVGLGMAGLASVLISQRVVRPLEALRQGARQLGAGALHHRIDLRTGNELEALADAFNHMAARLQASYADLEAQVAARTHELAQTVHALEIASQHKSQFLANMSHELRTPLNAIVGYTELILDDIYGAVPDVIREVLERVKYSADHLLKLINAVLDIARIEAGRFGLSLAEYSLREVVHTVMMALEHLATEKQLAMHVTVPSDLPNGWGDAHALTQVLFNLVGNAITYTEAGAITIAASEADGTFTLAVTDTGPGIAPEDQQRIFEAFEQVATSTPRSQRGTGLGLVICHHIIARHGGHIDVTSRLGKGATFWCTFPVRVEEARREDGADLSHRGP